MERRRPYRHSFILLISLPFFVSRASGANIHGRQGPIPPAQLPDTWSYKGCYTDSVGQRSLRGATFGSATQSADTCIAFCESRGYLFAGTEYSNECYCGNSVSSSGTAVTDGCSMACAGAAGEACGGPNRLSVYGRPAPVNVSDNFSFVGGTGTWSSLGCYSDAGGARILQYGVAVQGGGQNMSAQSCITSCESSKYKYAGTEYAGECYCGNTLDNEHTMQDDGCDMKCNGNITQVCGGANRISLYGVHVTLTASPSSSLVVPTPTPSAASSVSGAASSTQSSTIITSSLLSRSTTAKTGWYLEGCYVDGVGGRTLSVGTGIAGAMTNAKCKDACRSAGYVLAGTEYSGECYCDNQLRNNGGPAPDGDALCNMPCNGNQTEICGGPNRLTLFRYYTGDESTSSSAPSSSQTSSTVPIATGLPTGFTYKGCYGDGPGFRIMNYQQPDDQSMTIASCANKCSAAGYEIAGMEYSYQCFCDNVIRMGGKPAASESECSTKCAGNAGQTCGGPDRLSIWSSQTPLKVIQPPKPAQNVSDWKYQGCITEGGDGKKVFPWKLSNQTGNSPEWCLGRCKEYGYMAAGLEYGEECYCGDLDDVEKMGAQPAPESECSTPCTGDPEAICGAGNRLSWYKWTGDPVYVFQYPQGIAAGRYEFLVGGPIIPLIAQPGVNGKITLLEKHGTGAPNTTGAYELDPSIGGDIFHAFRELTGIKTDIFCAAGLTMPDRAGRQINIGGWSVDSLFGVRIYWPDGSPGVNGTNHWQEDVNTVKLQRGRWYPTGLVMANGSMLIVGGEDGSNGPPVPNMEILPTVGPVYEAQYLRDTDPFNLYPFLVVLPSGGIFIQYYNEARILNEVSLDTVKILPKAPGTVNDPTGGRTYPLEGTQVLLPQYYPYDAPLEVLICGGAGRQPQWGIDNCVSIQPDAPQPKWTIERMPSRRVISCMTTLPDGTYLILNGAEIGQAGFGLAESPNLNAVLYDSRKPRNQRMSIMANTTIARLYHSEAVLMDDGRVLVSGSDPQDGIHPQEYRYEVFLPPYILSGAPQPAFSLSQNDWTWEGTYSFTVTSGSAIKVSLLGSESSTHGSSMGARILFPQFSCSGNACTVTAPKGPYIAPVGWYRMFILDGPTPSHAKWVRIGGDPAGLGNWPSAAAFQPLPGVGPVGGAMNRAANSTVPGKFRV